VAVEVIPDGGILTGPGCNTTTPAAINHARQLLVPAGPVLGEMTATAVAAERRTL